MSALLQQKCPMPAPVYSQDVQLKPKSHLQATKSDFFQMHHPPCSPLFQTQLGSRLLARWLLVPATCSSKPSLPWAYQNPSAIVWKSRTGSQDIPFLKKKKKLRWKVYWTLARDISIVRQFVQAQDCHSHTKNPCRSHTQSWCGSEMLLWVRCTNHSGLSTPAQTGRPTAPGWQSICICKKTTTHLPSGNTGIIAQAQIKHISRAASPVIQQARNCRKNVKWPSQPERPGTAHLHHWTSSYRAL